MNIYSIIGFILAIAVLLFGLMLSTEKIGMFVDYPSMFIVLGGTFAALAISFQVNRFGVLLKVFFNRMIKGQRINYSLLITEIIQLSERYRQGEELKNLSKSSDDLFLTEALEVASNDVIRGERLFKLLESRVKNMHYIYMEEALKFKSMGKFPPAFGMMGTTIGMIVLLSNLGGADAIKMIGPAMSLCLLTTLYGVVIANLGVIPIAENLIDGTKEVHLKNKIIVEGIKLLLEKTNPIILAEELNSFLAVKDRLDWKDVLGK